MPPGITNFPLNVAHNMRACRLSTQMMVPHCKVYAAAAAARVKEEREAALEWERAASLDKLAFEKDQDDLRWIGRHGFYAKTHDHLIQSLERGETWLLLQDTTIKSPFDLSVYQFDRVTLKARVVATWCKLQLDCRRPESCFFQQFTQAHTLADMVGGLFQVSGRTVRRFLAEYKYYDAVHNCIIAPVPHGTVDENNEQDGGGSSETRGGPDEVDEECEGNAGDSTEAEGDSALFWWQLQALEEEGDDDYDVEEEEDDDGLTPASSSSPVAAQGGGGDGGYSLRHRPAIDTTVRSSKRRRVSRPASEVRLIPLKREYGLGWTPGGNGGFHLDGRGESDRADNWLCANADLKLQATAFMKKAGDALDVDMMAAYINTELVKCLSLDEKAAIPVKFPVCRITVWRWMYKLGARRSWTGKHYFTGTSGLHACMDAYH